MPTSAKIRCSVNNCHYWGQGNICDASQIMVTSDPTGQSKPDDFDASRAQQVPGTPVSTCMETCCKTFVKQGSDKTNVDGIRRV